MASDEASIRSFLSKLSRSPFTHFEASDGSFKMRIRRSENGAGACANAVSESTAAAMTEPETPKNALNSPRVGHFFPRLTGDGIRAFPEGVEIKEGDVYGIIESMHLKYECKAERTGVVEKWLADMGEGVEYGQALVELQEE